MTLNLNSTYVLLFKYLWILVLCPKELQFFLLLIYIIWINMEGLYKFKYYPDPLFRLMISFSVIHIISIIINAILYEPDLQRVVAAFNTAFIWIIAAFAYSFFKNHKIKIQKICKLSYVNLLIITSLACLSLISFYLLKNNKWGILRIHLYGIDWFRGKPKMRFKGGMEYSNLVVMFYILMFPLADSYLKQKGRFFRYLFILISFVPVILSLSRSGYLITGLAYFMAFLLCREHKRRDYLFIAALISVSIILLLLYKEDAENSIHSFILARAGSNHTRIQIYLESIKLAFENSPVWGMGIKHISETGYPLGSHSTYIGVFYKTGVTGTLLFVCILLEIAKILFSAKADRTIRMEAVFVAILFIEFIFEDMDGADWVIVLLFAIIGMIGYEEKQDEISGQITDQNRSYI